MSGDDKTIIYTNVSERYGDEVEVTYQDYLNLNPDGDFIGRYNGYDFVIEEYDKDGKFIQVVAVGYVSTD